MSKKYLFILLLIVLFGFFLRFYDIENNPKGIYGDELTAVYDAYSLLRTGMDQKGNNWPLVFELGGSRPPGYVYATIPFVAIFGPNALSARTVSILSGIGLIIVLFFLGKLLLNERLGLIIAFVAAVSPWSLSISRGGFESNFALFVATFATLAFLKGVKEDRWFLLSAILFALSIQIYPTYRLVIPLFFGFIMLLNRKLIFHLKKPLVILGTTIFVASFLLSLFLTLGRGKDDRFANINIFSDPDIRRKTVDKINFDRNIDNLPPFFSGIFHNKYIEYGSLYMSNYLNNFSTGFLFLNGDKQPRHNPSEMGQFYLVDIIFVVFGFIFLFLNQNTSQLAAGMNGLQKNFPKDTPSALLRSSSFKKDKKILWLVLGWIIIAPIATALVGEPHALRSSFLLPAILLLSALGISYILSSECKYKRITITFLSLVFFIQFVLLSDRIYFLSPNKNYNFWSYSAKKAVLIAVKNKDNFDTIFISNNIQDTEFAYPVFARLDPNEVIEQNKNNTFFGNSRFLKYDNVYIGSLPYGDIKNFIDNFPGTVLYIGSAEKEGKYLKDYHPVVEVDGWQSLAIYTKGGGLVAY